MRSQISEQVNLRSRTKTAEQEHKRCSTPLFVIVPVEQSLSETHINDARSTRFNICDHSPTPIKKTSYASGTHANYQCYLLKIAM